MDDLTIQFASRQFPDGDTLYEPATPNLRMAGFGLCGLPMYLLGGYSFIRHAADNSLAVSYRDLNALHAAAIKAIIRCQVILLNGSVLRSIRSLFAMSKEEWAEVTGLSLDLVDSSETRSFPIARVQNAYAATAHHRLGIAGDGFQDTDRIQASWYLDCSWRDDETWGVSVNIATVQAMSQQRAFEEISGMAPTGPAGKAP